MLRLRQRQRSRDILFAVVDANNLASEFFRQENGRCPFATGYVEYTACGIQAKHAP